MIKGAKTMSIPLAERMRPKELEDLVGQEHLLAKDALLSNIVASGHLPNMVFYGPPGTGKTTIARIIAAKTERKLHKLNGTSASTADIRAIIAQLDTLAAPNGILLYLDEIQYFNKKQQQSLLEYIESGAITLIASTTENPFFYIYGAILSRSTIFEFKPIQANSAISLVERGFEFLQKEKNEEFEIENGVIKYIASTCGGDMRKALNAVELCFLSSNTPNKNSKRLITLKQAKMLSQKSALRYDREGDEHYDLLSAFQKSMRGSDANAALHYLARILEAGDMPSATRRLLVCACEDVGLAYPMIMSIVKAAVDIAFQVGMPEARIPLANAVILVCNSPKSNSAYLAIGKAFTDINSGKTGPIPRHLQNVHADTTGQEREQGYLYPHSYDMHWINQQYLPDILKDVKYYTYGNNKNELAAKEYWEKIKGFDADTRNQ